MNSLLLALGAFITYGIAYRLYGRYLGEKIFKLNSSNPVPAIEQQDGSDFVPTKKGVLFGHHFTSIAGLGPVVGPAIAIIWGWLPALLWVLFGSIFMGAVHDFGTLVLSMRHRGRSVGDITGDLISPRVRMMFLTIMFLAVFIVIAVFALIIAILFHLYPSAVLPVWGELPIAIAMGYLVYKKGKNHHLLSIIGIILMYILVFAGAYLPVKLPVIGGFNPIVLWTIILLIYAYIASVLPVTTLLQPRDYLNGHQLFIAMMLLGAGIVVTHPTIVAPALNTTPAGAPPILPFLFIVIACGAISGFHSLVSSGTTSKQCATEQDALPIGYGGMILEGVLAVVVIVAIGGGLGLGLNHNGTTLTGALAFETHYASWGAASGLAAKLGAFVQGASNMLAGIGIPIKIGVTIMGVFLVSFAATTLDSATRVQRYIVSELAESLNLPKLAKPHPATLIAVGSAALLCFHGGFSIKALKMGALSLWPLFGVTNQLLAMLALVAVTVYLARRRVNIYVTLIPALLMLIITIWGSIVNLQTFFNQGKWVLFAIAMIAMILELWIVFEGISVVKKLKKTAEPVPV